MVGKKNEQEKPSLLPNNERCQRPNFEDVEQFVKITATLEKNLRNGNQYSNDPRLK